VSWHSRLLITDLPFHTLAADVTLVRRHGVFVQPPPPAYPGSMEHVWQSLQQEEGAEGRDAAANGLQDGSTDGLQNGSHPAAQPREKCWIHRVRCCCCGLCALHYRTFARSRTFPVCWHGTRKSFGSWFVLVSCMGYALWLCAAQTVWGARDPLSSLHLT